MSGEHVAESRSVIRVSAYPRCDICGRVVRVRGVGENMVWCVKCLTETLPFNLIEGEGDFRGALRE